MARNKVLGLALALLSTSSAWGVPQAINFQGGFPNREPPSRALAP